MASFEMFPRDPNPMFMSSGNNASLSIISGPLNAVHVALRGGVMIDRELEVGVDLAGANVIKIERAFLTAPPDLRVFRLTGANVGSTIIDAREPSSKQVMASLAVLVTEPQSAASPPKVLAVDPLANFEIGFVEGLSTANGTAAVKALITAIRTNPGKFYAGYIDGLVSGLWAGVKDLFDGLVALGAIAPYVGLAMVPGVGAAVIAWKLSDPEFQKKAKEKAEWAASVARAAKGVVEEFDRDKAGSVVKYLNASRDAGRKIGEAFATEIDKKTGLAGPIEYGQWIGWAVGRIAFEVIVIFATEGIGEAVRGASAGGQGLKGVQAVGEAAELFARVRTKIQEVLRSLPALEKFVKTLTTSKSAAEAAALAKVVTDAAEAATRASKAAEAAKVAKGTADAAEAAAKAAEAMRFAEAARNAKTTTEAAEAAGKAKSAAEAAEAAAKKATVAAEDLGNALDRQFGKLERGELAQDQGAMLGDLFVHGQREEALAQLRQQIGHVPARPGKTPPGAAVNPQPGFQSAHTTPQAAMRSLPQYNPDEMITRFLRTGKGHSHTVFDQAWQREFAAIARQTGRSTTTARELEEVVGRAARNSGAFSRAEGESVAQLIKNDLYFQLGLSPETVLRMPRH